jgi:BirA family biotin operon repressor/biotin-[acetyl-CoA-carboxylase] ligase
VSLRICGGQRLLLDGKKCAGILVQLVDGVLITGIGINVNHTAFPHDLAPIATSLRQALGGSMMQTNCSMR